MVCRKEGIPLGGGIRGDRGVGPIPCFDAADERNRWTEGSKDGVGWRTLEGALRNACEALADSIGAERGRDGAGG